VRSAIATHLGVADDLVAVGAGSLGVIQQLLAAFAGPGDDVVYPWRSFEAYPIVITAAGATGVPVPLAGDDIDLDAMLAAVTCSTRVVLLCLPNNPTGTSPAPVAIARFIATLPSDVLVVLDEAYVEFMDAAASIDSLALVAGNENVCVVRTFSKAYGLAGLRVGYVVGPQGIVHGIRQAALPFAVSRPGQIAAIASLAAPEELASRVTSTVAERSRVLAAARAAGWTVPDSQTNFIWLRVDDATAARLQSAFDEQLVVARYYPGDGVRVSVGLPLENDRVIRALQAAAS
jgi:histidinol-phosphate aminotransferase